MKTILLALFFVSFSALAIPEESQLLFKNNIFSYYGSHGLSEQNASIQKAIIVVHGSERNADTYYKSIENMARKFGQSESTIIISTHFKLPTDKLLPGELTWTDEGWLSGDPSLVNQDISSFEVMDHFLELLGSKSVFPNLKKIIVTGHSAGGQLTQRYAFSSLADKKIPQIKVKYIVLNPGSYLYLSPNRPIAVPENTCTHYDNYKFGLKKLNAYASRAAVADLISHYLNRDVTYLIGDKDIIAHDIDQSCPAVAQGNTRLERAQYFKMQLDQEFPEQKHPLITVPDIGHTQWGMYTSPIGSNLLFGN